MEFTKGQIAAEQLTNFLNSATMEDREEFVTAILAEHRELQQRVFNLMVNTQLGFATLDKTESYDYRNEYAVKQSVKIAEFLNK